MAKRGSKIQQDTPQHLMLEMELSNTSLGMNGLKQSEHRSASSVNQPRMYDVGLLTSHDCC